jgi:redox-sensitive bicupin YhaK (pirin superfamily)
MGAALKAGETVNHLLSSSSQIYLVAVRGSVRVNEEPVETGDGVAIADAPRVAIEAATDAEVLMVEVR